MKPKPHQVIAIRDITKAFKTNNKVQAHMACGSGKTFIAYQMTTKIRSTVTVMFVPTIMLVHQGCQDFIKYGSKKENVLVCVDLMTKLEKEEIGYLAMNGHINVGSSIPKIKKAIGSKKEMNIFCTYASARNLLKILNQMNIKIDFAVFDESHHITSEHSAHALRIYQKVTASCSKLLSLTASPRESNKIDLGPVAHRLSFSKAVQENILCPYKIQMSLFECDNTSEEIEQLAAIEAIKETIKKGGKRGLTFHSSIARAQVFERRLKKDLKKINIFHLSGHNTHSERIDVIDKVRNKGGIITNVKVLGEGFDFPELDYIVVVDPKASIIDITQNVGRVMRKSEGKEWSRVVIPMVIGSNHAATETAKLSFKNTITALAEHDEILMQLLNDIRDRKKEPSELEHIVDMSFMSELPDMILQNLKHELVDVFKQHRSFATVEADTWAFIKKYGFFPRQATKGDHNAIDNTESELGYMAYSLYQVHKNYHKTDHNLIKWHEEYSLVALSAWIVNNNLPLLCYGKFNRTSAILKEFAIDPIIATHNGIPRVLVTKAQREQLSVHLTKWNNNHVRLPTRVLLGGGATSSFHRIRKQLKIEPKITALYGTQITFYTNKDFKTINDLMTKPINPKLLTS